jgi:hypothetical protein
MSGLAIDCPICERAIEILEREMKLAVQHKRSTGDKPLVSCPKCCRVMELTGPLPENVQEWLVNLDDIICVPFLDDTYVKLPAGYQLIQGLKMYRPGGGGKLLRRRDYMYQYGMDPECRLKK